MQNQAVLQLKNIHKSYGDLHVLKGMDLTAYSGQVVSLIGSSGSGKSTLLRCANLLEIPQSGEVIFQGQVVEWRAGKKKQERQPADAEHLRLIRSELSMVFQQFNLWSHMTIGENVIVAPIHVKGVSHAEAEDRARRLLDKVGIGDKVDMYPNQLSGGQQQRAAIARALAMEPAAMLFDEPTSALDPELEQEVARVICDLADEGRTMILVTHDMSLARELSHQILFLHQGQVEEQGTPEQLFGNPQSERLRGFLSSALA